MRLFLALELPEPLKVAVGEAVAPLQAAGPAKEAAADQRSRERAGVRWARNEGLHLTLVFLGETPEARLPGLCAAVDRVAARHPPLRLGLRGAGTFGRPKAPRVLWLGVTGAVEQAQRLQADLAAAVELLEDRPWSPHLTLGRARSDRGEPFLVEAAARLQPLSLGPFEATGVTLFETRGGRYVARHRSALGDSVATSGGWLG